MPIYQNGNGSPERVDRLYYNDETQKAQPLREVWGLKNGQIHLIWSLSNLDWGTASIPVTVDTSQGSVTARLISNRNGVALADDGITQQTVGWSSERPSEPSPERYQWRVTNVGSNAPDASASQAGTWYDCDSDRSFTWTRPQDTNSAFNVTWQYRVKGDPDSVESRTVIFTFLGGGIGPIEPE